MNIKLALASLAALGGFAALANSVTANPDIRVGIHFGSPAPVYRPAVPAYCPPAPVIVSNYGNDRHDRNDRFDRPSGYWKEVVVKTWVPMTYVVIRDWRGRPERRIEPAHFAYRTDRVWVGYRG